MQLASHPRVQNDSIIDLPGKKILIVDDRIVTRKLVIACLRKQEYHISQVDNVHEATRLVDVDLPDLIILNHDQLYYQVKQLSKLIKHCSASKLLLISSAVNIDLPIPKDLRQDSILEIPFSPIKLRRRIEKLLFGC